jgi:hypothetical protein
MRRQAGRLTLVIGLALGLTTAVLSATTQTAVAVGAQDYTDAQLTIANDVASGSYTQDELAQAQQDPALADITENPDPYAVTEADETEDEANYGLASQGDPTYTAGKDGVCPAGSKEHFMGHSWTHHSLLGSTIYKWHWDIWYCRNDGTGKITKWTHWADFVTNAQWMVVWTNDKTTIMDSLPAVKGKAYRQRHLQLCYAVKFACANRYPWGRGTAYGLGYDP